MDEMTPLARRSADYEAGRDAGLRAAADYLRSIAAMAETPSFESWVLACAHHVLDMQTLTPKAKPNDLHRTL